MKFSKFVIFELFQQPVPKKMQFSHRIQFPTKKYDILWKKLNQNIFWWMSFRTYVCPNIFCIFSIETILLFLILKPCIYLKSTYSCACFKPTMVKIELEMKILLGFLKINEWRKCPSDTICHSEHLFVQTLVSSLKKP